MNAYPPGQISPEEEARLLEIRQNAVRKIRTLSILMTVVSTLSICIGIAILGGIKDSGWPLVSGSPIWSGILVLSGAICGLVLGSSNSDWINPEDKSKQRCLFVGFYSVAITSLSFCGLSVGYSTWSAFACAGEYTNACGKNYKYETIANAIAILLALILLTCCIIGSVMFCVYKHAFKFYSYNDRIEQMQRLIYQQQQTIAAINQVQTPGTQTCVSNYNVYGTQWVATPPPYTEKLPV